MKGTIVLSAKDVQRLKVLEQVDANTLTLAPKEAGRSMNVSYRALV